MRNATEILEAARVELGLVSSAEQTINGLNRLIGTIADPGLRTVLATLRSQAVTQLASEEVARVQGWTQWLTAFAESVAEFDSIRCRVLVGADLPFLRADGDRVERLRRLADYYVTERWPEAYDLFLELGRDPALEGPAQAKQFVSAAEVQIFHFLDMSEAEAHLQEATRLAPSLRRVLYGWGEFRLSRGELDAASDLARQLIDGFPGESDGWVLQGDIHVKREEARAAEAAYQTAISIDPGDTRTYRSLLRLYGRLESIQENRAKLQALVELVADLEPDQPMGRYSAYLGLGFLYHEASDLPTARDWYHRANELDSTLGASLVAEALTYLEEKAYDEVEATLRKAIDVEPDSYDAHSGLAMLNEGQERYEEAIGWYEQARALRPQWGAKIGASIGQLWRKLGDLERAEKELVAALRLDPDEQTALKALDDLADAWLAKGDAEGANRVLGEIRAIKGDPYEAEYRNRLGTLSYFQKQYDPAIEGFERAISLSPEVALYRTNMAYALRAIHRFDQARAQFAEAFRIAGNEAEYHDGIALTANEEGNELLAQSRFEEAVAKYREALSFRPKDAVVHANLALALESITAPGQRLTLLSEAIQELHTARELDAQNPSYEQRLSYLETRKRFIRERGERALDLLPVVTPIIAGVSDAFVPLVTGEDSSGLSPDVLSKISRVRDDLTKEFGVVIPGVRFRGSGATEGLTYQILLFEVETATGTIPPDRSMVTGAVERLAALGLVHEEASDPATGRPAAWVASADVDLAVGAGLQVWGPVDCLLRHVAGLVRKNLSSLLGHQDVWALLEGWEGAAAGVRDDPMQLSAFTQVLRGLLDERVPIIALDPMCEAFAAEWKPEADLTALGERFRSLPQVLPRLPGITGHQHVSLGEELEERVAGWLERGKGRALVAPPAAYEGFTRSLATLLRSHATQERPLAVVVSDPRLRPFVAVLVPAHGKLPVLSELEIAMASRLEPAAVTVARS